MTVSRPSERLAANSALLSALGLLNRGLTVVTQIVIASVFGESADADAFFAVEILPDLFIVLVGSGFSMAAIPIYGRLRSKAAGTDSDEHREFAGSFIASLTVLFLLATAVLYLLAPFVVGVLAPGFDDGNRELTVTLFRLVILVLAFLGPEAGLRAIFHSHRVFAAPELARFGYNSLLLAFTVLLHDRLGVVAIGWGMVAGAAVMMGVLLFRARQLGLLPRLTLGLHPAVVALLRTMPAVLVVLAWPMVLPLLDRIQASGYEVGSLSALGYASRLALLPIGIVVLPVAAAVYPLLSELASEGSRQRFGAQLTNGLRAVLFVVLPLTALLVVGREDVVELLFQRGQFDAEATQRTSRAVLYYVLGLPGLAAAFFLRNAYLALDRSWSLCWLSLLSWVGAWFLNVIFGAYWGVPGVAAATAVIATATSVGMIVHLASRCEVDLRLSESWLPIALMSGLSIGASVLVAGGYALGLAVLDSSGLFARLCVLGLASIFALVAYVAAARMALLSEAVWLVRRLQAIRTQVASR